MEDQHSLVPFSAWRTWDLLSETQEWEFSTNFDFYTTKMCNYSTAFMTVLLRTLFLILFYLFFRHCISNYLMCCYIKVLWATRLFLCILFWHFSVKFLRLTGPEIFTDIIHNYSTFIKMRAKWVPWIHSKKHEFHFMCKFIINVTF